MHNDAQRFRISARCCKSNHLRHSQSQKVQALVIWIQFFKDLQSEIVLDFQISQIPSAWEGTAVPSLIPSGEVWWLGIWGADDLRLKGGLRHGDMR